MAALGTATTLRENHRGFTATIDENWCAWSPAGGYLMTLALRAAGRATEFAAPLSASCHFLSAPKLGDVDLEVSSIRRTRVAESLRVSMTQSGKPVIELLVWCGAPVDGYEHFDAQMPDVPPHDEVPTREAPEGIPGFQSVWKNLEHRACGPLHWEHEDKRAPRQLDWIRLVDFEPGEDPYLDAGRTALVLDSFTWPAAGHAHTGDPRFIAPTISFSIEFHQATTSPWLLSEAHSPTGREGRLAVHNRLWDPSGELIATGSGTLICRPRQRH